MNALTPEEKEVGKHNFHEACGVSRREFLQGVIGAGVVSGSGLGALYFGYSSVNDPVRIGVIGTGDEGNVLIGALTPAFQTVVAIADIRPYNIHRAFHGDWASDAAQAARCGLMKKYRWATEDAARKKVKVYDKDYHDLINDPDVEAVVIALPLHLHAKVAIECMQAGKHVLTEKLMGHNVAQCKVMSRVAEETDLYLATGHQRHYSVLYDNAVNLLRWGIMGQIHHIRAQWHRSNLPGRDSWKQPLPGGEVQSKTTKRVDKILDDLNRFKKAIKDKNRSAEDTAKLAKKIAQWEAWNKDRDIKPAEFDYEEMVLSDGRVRSAMEELCRWRLWQRTGGGLMAELGSHQLDAASIFISAMRSDGKKAHPLSVHAVGGRAIFGLDRQAEDHVYCMFEFPGPAYDPSFDVGYSDPVTDVPDPEKGVPGYDQDPHKKIVVTYSSINGNGFGGYGEIVLGTKGTLVLEREQEVMLYKTSDTKSKIGIKKDKGGPTMDTQASGPPTAAATSQAAAAGPVSRGYTEELEHWAWCIRNKAPENQPRCRPEVAAGDAIIALTANVAIRKSMKGEAGFVRFDEEWFDIHSDKTSDGSSIEEETTKLVKKT